MTKTTDPSAAIAAKIGPGALIVLRDGESLETAVHAHLTAFQRRYGVGRLPVLVLVPEGVAAPGYVLGNVPVQQSRHLMLSRLVYLVAAVNAIRQGDSARQSASLKFREVVPKSS